MFATLPPSYLLSFAQFLSETPSDFAPVLMVKKQRQLCSTSWQLPLISQRLVGKQRASSRPRYLLVLPKLQATEPLKIFVRSKVGRTDLKNKIITQTLSTINS